MPNDYSTTSSPNFRSVANSSASGTTRNWTIYTDSSYTKAKVKPAYTTEVNTVIETMPGMGGDPYAINANRHASGIPVVTDTYGLAAGVTKLTVADVVPAKSFDSGFGTYWNSMTGERVAANFTYVNKPVQVKGTDGKILYWPGYYVADRTENMASAVSIDAKPPVDMPDSTKDVKWNLPPHKWSLPLFASSNSMITPGASRKPSSDRYRRGRVWFRNMADTYTVDGSGKKVYNKGATLEAHQYGFQFLWNPESLTTTVAVQMDATPNVNDQWIGAAGLFPATENFSIAIRLDRTNDFARAGSKFAKRPSQINETKDPAMNDFINRQALRDLIKDYIVADSFSKDASETQMIDNLQDLFQRGTLADLEFLFRAINGKGPSALTDWISPRGIATADIGYLSPTLLHIDVGPLSYIGWVTNLTVNHIGFTQDMIPIRTDVTMSFNTLSTAGIGSDIADRSVLTSGTPEYAAAVNTTGRIPTNSTSSVAGKKLLPPDKLNAI